VLELRSARGSGRNSLTRTKFGSALVVQGFSTTRITNATFNDPYDILVDNASTLDIGRHVLNRLQSLKGPNEEMCSDRCLKEESARLPRDRGWPRAVRLPCHKSYERGDNDQKVKPGVSLAVLQGQYVRQACLSRNAGGALFRSTWADRGRKQLRNY
jgi:hypothetical protein